MKPMLIGDVAKRLGVSNERIRQMDGVLKPDKQLCGCRVYNPKYVEQVARDRIKASVAAHVGYNLSRPFSDDIRVDPRKLK